MVRYIAFLRGINVSGQKLIKMEALKDCFNSMGFEEVITYIQSGNVAFSCKKSTDEALRKKIETQILKSIGYEVPTLIRTREELEAIIAKAPLKESTGKKLYITMLSGEADASKVDSLIPYCNENEELAYIGKDLYFTSPSYGNSKLSNNLVEKKLGLQATTRNLATITKMAKL